MDYAEANAQLQGRCYMSRKLCNNTYLKRDGDEINIRLHSTDVITFYKDGRVSLYTGGWDTITTKGRINNYQDVARFFTERGVAFLSLGRNWAGRYLFHGRVTILADGTVEGCDEEARVKELEAVYEGWRETDRENARISRWLHKARGIKRDSSQCTKKDGTRLSRGWGGGCDCHPSGAFRRSRSNLTMGTCKKCGCRGIPWPASKGLTVEKIMAEANVTVRMAMAHVYGLERFLIDAKAQTLDTHGEYALLSMPMGGFGWRNQRITALKMTCPSTNAVYISPVDPDCQTVAKALDWYFQTTDYLGTLKAEA